MILVTVCLFLDCVSPIFCEVEGSGNIQHGGHTISYTRGYLLDLQRTDPFNGLHSYPSYARASLGVSFLYKIIYDLLWFCLFCLFVC